MRTRRRPMRLLHPFSPVEQGMANERIATAIAVVEGVSPGLHECEPAWFGDRLDGDVRLRYMAIGYTAAADRGLDEGRAYVVDVRSGHVIWQRPITARGDLPRNITALGG
jgi:hypothetical protein